MTAIHELVHLITYIKEFSLRFLLLFSQQYVCTLTNNRSYRLTFRTPEIKIRLVRLSPIKVVITSSYYEMYLFYSSSRIRSSLSVTLFRNILSRCLARKSFPSSQDLVVPTACSKWSGKHSVTWTQSSRLT